MRQRTRVLIALALVLCDVIGINAGFIGAYWALYGQIANEFSRPADSQRWWFLILFNAACALIFIAYRLYHFKRGTSRVDEAYTVFVAISIAALVATVIATLVGLRFTTWMLIAAWLSAVALTVLLRNVHRSVVYALRKRGYDQVRTLIVGAGPVGQMIAQVVIDAPHLGYDVQGFLDDDASIGTTYHAAPVLGRLRDIRRVVRTCRISEILIALPGIDPQRMLDLVGECADEPVAIKIYPDTFQIITNNELSLGDLGGLPLMSVKSSPLDRGWNRALKRAVDMFGALIGLIVLSPLMLLVALLVKLESPGPALFIQERVGTNGELFPMIKFRSMRVDSEERGPGWTVENDPRRTRIGTFIRRYSIDELPQLINVLLGDMSLVGPRAEQPFFVERFSQQIPHYMRRHKEKAGITGWAQVNGLRGDTPISERTRYDLYYVENWSVLFDIKIIVRTLAGLFRADNAY
jgi:exopolysaccharide biosynthesis polyprenyl glycosylphosphotransferase